MKKIMLLLLASLLTTSAWAAVDLSTLLNKVQMQLKVEQWLTTQTAEVNVSVNASVNDQGIERIQNHVLSKLKQLSNRGEWHIIRYNRVKDASGLESVRISAQVRLPQSELASLRSKAKSISKPGEDYKIDRISFTPSDDEVRVAKDELREKIYEYAKKEIAKLNKIYPTEKFYIYRIDFTNAPAIMPMAENAMYRSAKVGGVAAQPLNIGNKLDMLASVTLASMPEPLAKKSPLIN